MSAITLEDTGLFTLTIRSAPGEDDAAPEAVTRSLDLWQVHNHLYQIRKDMEGKPVTDYHTAVVNYLVELGFPLGSHKLADDFVVAIRNAVAETAKKNGTPTSTTADSPAFTPA